MPRLDSALAQLPVLAVPEDVGGATGPAGAGSCPACIFWKHDRQSTGRPWVGRKGTVVSSPQAEQWVRVSVLTRGPPFARLALHCLQRFGSFLKSLSWKKSCSPAVKMNSEPQSMHFRTLSVNSMAGFPEGGNLLKSAIDLDAPVPFPCLRTLSNNKGPGREQYKRLNSAPTCGEPRRYCIITRQSECDCSHDPLYRAGGLNFVGWGTYRAIGRDRF
jgi:hypothetical protein